MGDHGGSAVDVSQRLPQQHCQFAVPVEHIYTVISKGHGRLSDGMACQYRKKKSKRDKAFFKFSELTPA